MEVSAFVDQDEYHPLLLLTMARLELTVAE